MKLTTIKSLVATAMVAAGFAAVAAPKVTIDRIGNGSVWSTKIVTYTVSDVPEGIPDVSYELAFDVTAYSVTTNIKMGVAQNGTFTNMLDTAAIFGETRKDPKAKLRVSVEAKWDLEPVQLWADGPYFAKCNVGANAPHEFGYYFWWGDTVGYVRNSSNDGWVSSKDGTTPIRFSNLYPPANSTTDMDLATLKERGYIDDVKNPVLNAAYDPARAHLGGSWRMPTAVELSKLRDCPAVWTDNWNNTGVRGLIVMGQEGYESNRIFLPVAGSGVDDVIFTSEPAYWSSCPEKDSQAVELFFDENGFHSGYTLGSRSYGDVVRPVR